MSKIVVDAATRKNWLSSDAMDAWPFRFNDKEMKALAERLWKEHKPEAFKNRYVLEVNEMLSRKAFPKIGLPYGTPPWKLEKEEDNMNEYLNPELLDCLVADLDEMENGKDEEPNPAPIYKIDRSFYFWIGKKKFVVQIAPGGFSVACFAGGFPAFEDHKQNILITEDWQEVIALLDKEFKAAKKTVADSLKKLVELECFQK